MTSNLLGDAGDAPGLVEAAAEADVDVLAVEELSTGALAELDRAGLAELFPFRAGEAAPGGTAGTMVFAREPITDVRRLPTDFGSWSVLVGEVRVFAVHPVYALETAAWRDEHAALLAVAEEQQPDLLLGDFNATLDHGPMRRLDAAGYRDATELSGSGWQPTWPATGTGIQGLLPPVIQIDHVLVDDGWSAARTWTVEIDGSDHRALVAEVRSPRRVTPTG
jgi:endonuclease/exonuclease/phosphatase family metal-dependent hydrolase